VADGGNVRGRVLRSGQFASYRSRRPDTFEWLEGRFFLVQRLTNEFPSAPNGLAIIGLGMDPETFTQHYYDSRGVTRVYRMTLRDAV
jgi:hypothetical protein